MTEPMFMDHVEMLRRIPQRYPFLFVDRVLSWDAERRHLVAAKNVTGNESFFQGHFPEDPVMPGTLMIEAMGQSASLVASLLDHPDAPGGNGYYLALADALRFRRLVRPGDVLVLHARCDAVKRRFFRIDCRCEVAEGLAAAGVVVLARRQAVTAP